MLSANGNGISLCKNDNDEITAFLEQYEAYILAQVRRQIPRNMFSPEVIDLETDELVQKSRIKLWQILQEKVITNPRAYIKAIVHSEAVNVTRLHRPPSPLPMDADGELPQDCAIGRSGEDTQDPAVIFEQKEAMAEHTARAVRDALTLPQCQRRAMICALKEALDDERLLSQELGRHGVDIQSANWPRDKAAAHRSKASLAPARKKLCRLRKRSRSR